MTFAFSIYPGWWLLPLAITVAVLGWAHWVMTRPSTTNALFGMGGGIIAIAVLMTIALVVTAAWLIWAIASLFSGYPL